MPRSLIFPDVSCCVKDGGDILEGGLEFNILNCRHKPVHQIKTSSLTDACVSLQNKRDFTLWRHFRVMPSAVYARVAGTIHQTEQQALPSERGASALFHHVPARNTQLKSTIPAYRAGQKLCNQFHLDSALPPERLWHFAVCNSNTRWISKAINHSRQGTARQL